MSKKKLELEYHCVFILVTPNRTQLKYSSTNEWTILPISVNYNNMQQLSNIKKQTTNTQGVMLNYADENGPYAQENVMYNLL